MRQRRRQSTGYRDASGRWHWHRPDYLPDGAVVRPRMTSDIAPLRNRLGVVVGWDSVGRVAEVSFRVRSDDAPHLDLVSTDQHRREARESGVRLVGWGRFSPFELDVLDEAAARKIHA